MMSRPMRVFRIPFSTNVERVALALGHKGVAVEWVDVDPADRSPVRDVSGQDLVPVLQTDENEIVVDSMQIVAWLLEGRDHLMGDGFGAADVAAFPFLKYGVMHDPDDDELFHRILMERLPVEGVFPRVEAWIRRVDERPRA